MHRLPKSFPLILVFFSSLPAAAQERIQYSPPTTPSSLGLAGYSKVLCSAVFVSGRDADEAARNSGYFLMPEADRSAITGRVIDREKKQVQLTLRQSLTRTARFYGDQGCVILPEGSDRVFFEPVPVKSALPDPLSQPWPMGDSPPAGPPAAGPDAAKLEEGVDLAFADPEALTAALVVVHRGRIVAERYAPGITKDTQLESWSMGKSLTATLVGILIREGHFGLFDRAPVPEWSQPGDPRGAIRIADLMRMSSGLRFIAPHDPDYSVELGYPDHMYIYTGAINAFEFSYRRPLQFLPNTEGRYRNSDPLTLGYIIKETVTRGGENYFSFAQRKLFDRIGIRKMVLEPDPYGNFLLTGYDYGTARNWARLGLLYLQDGVFEGERLLPEGFVDFVRTPAPAWKEPVYGGLFWLNRTGEWPLPPDTYYMAGGGGQRTLIVPSLDLVIVRMGHFRGEPAGMKAFKAALEKIVPALRPKN
jgi:CubicO group peptidase (beta-lactamase class C family)